MSLDTVATTTGAAPQPEALAHRFSVQADWAGPLKVGSGTLATSTQTATYSVPQRLGGKGEGLNAEELLLSSAATCFLITLQAVANGRGLTVQSLAVESMGTFTFDGRRLTLTGLVHTLKAQTAPEDTTALRAYALLAERGCMVSRALNVPVSVVFA